MGTLCGTWGPPALRDWGLQGNGLHVRLCSRGAHNQAALNGPVLSVILPDVYTICNETNWDKLPRTLM